jgi:hypothetical protein
MKQIAILMVLSVFALSTMSVSAQTAGKDQKTYQIPAEHAEFVKEYQTLLQKYPYAAARFALADRGPEPRQPVIIWKCTEFGGGHFDCVPVEKE